MRPPTLSHVLALSDDTGIIQHATYDVPNRSTGYCTDDVARAFIVALQAAAYPQQREEALQLARTYLSFLHDAQLPDGRFRNFMSYQQEWLEDVGSDDSFGRALWALGFGMSRAPLESWRTLCREMLERALACIPRLEWIHSRAYATLGLVYALESERAPQTMKSALRALADRFVSDFRRCDDGRSWRWYEDVLTYDNARLCEAVIRAGMALGDATCVDVGLSTLRFLESLTFEGDRFVPIGNQGWYRRGGNRARFDQQPLEAAAMVDAELAAYAATQSPERLRRAEDSFSWYLGRNDRGESLVRDGGCCDGFSESALNTNMGAESTLARLSSAFALAEAQTASVSKYPSDDRRNRGSERRPA